MTRDVAQDLRTRVATRTWELFNGFSFGTTWVGQRHWIIQNGKILQLSVGTPLEFRGFRLPSEFEIIFNLKPPYPIHLYINLECLARPIDICFQNVGHRDRQVSKLSLAVRVHRHEAGFRFFDAGTEQEIDQGTKNLMRTGSQLISKFSFSGQSDRKDDVVLAIESIYLRELVSGPTENQFKMDIIQSAPNRHRYFKTLTAAVESGLTNPKNTSRSSIAPLLPSSFNHFSSKTIGRDRHAKYDQISAETEEGVRCSGLIVKPVNSKPSGTAVILHPSEYFSEMIAFYKLGQMQNICRFFIERNMGVFIPSLLTSTPIVPRQFAVPHSAVRKLKLDMQKKGYPLLRFELDMVCGMYKTLQTNFDWPSLDTAVGWCATNSMALELPDYFSELKSGILISAGGIFSTAAAQHDTINFSKFRHIPLLAQYGLFDMDFPINEVNQAIANIPEEYLGASHLTLQSFDGFHEFDAESARSFLNRLSIGTPSLCPN